jgi:hypothetical protein
MILPKPNKCTQMNTNDREGNDILVKEFIKMTLRSLEFKIQSHQKKSTNGTCKTSGTLLRDQTCKSWA